MSEIIEFGEIHKGDIDSDGHLGDMVGKIMHIKAVEFGKLETLGDYAVVTAQVGNEIKRLHTFSAILIKQLKKIEPYVAQGKIVKAKLIKRKNYYTFE